MSPSSPTDVISGFAFLYTLSSSSASWTFFITSKAKGEYIGLSAPPVTKFFAAVLLEVKNPELNNPGGLISGISWPSHYQS